MSFRRGEMQRQFARIHQSTRGCKCVKQSKIGQAVSQRQVDNLIPIGVEGGMMKVQSRDTDEQYQSKERADDSRKSP